jgi:predicted small secreted protein
MTKLHRPTLIVLGLVLITALVVAGCNTARGFGKDVEKTGEKIQEKASR